MYIRQTKMKTGSDGESYYTHRLVETKRVDKRVVQSTIINLGSNFDLQKDLWPDLCIRIEQLLNGESPLFATNPTVEELAQSTYRQILAKRAELVPTQNSEENQQFEEVDIQSLQQIHPRSVGAEYVSLEALKELQIPELLTELGFNAPQRAAALGNIVGRMCAPASEHATLPWLQKDSALGELLSFDFNSISPMGLYRASDKLLAKKDQIEQSIFERVQSIFHFEPTITLYDLTNTYMEGSGQRNPKAERGRSKEKRSDCPLVTLGVALDASGFIRHSAIFDGNVGEATTLEGMLEKLMAPKNAIVIMDAGIASQDNLDWLTEHHFKYIVVSRKRRRDFDREKAHTITSASGYPIHLQRQSGESENEVQLACWSEQRGHKDEAINKRFRKSYEEALKAIAAGLSKPGTTKKRDALHQRLGRLKEKHKRVSAHYEISFEVDEKTDVVRALHWQYQPQEASKLTHPGVYTLRTTLTDWSDEQLWRSYMTLTDLESVFRSLKSDLGLRPVYHSSESRCDGHLFITVLAYQAVQVIRRKLCEGGEMRSWGSLREVLKRQCRITATFKQRDGRTLHVRQASRPEPELAAIYEKLGLSPLPGGVKKMRN